MIEAQASAILKTYAGTVATNATTGYTWEFSVSNANGGFKHVEVDFVGVPTTQATDSTHVLDSFGYYEGDTTVLTNHTIVSGCEGSATPAATQFQLTAHTVTNTNYTIRIFRTPGKRYGSIRWGADANYTTFAFVVRGVRPDQAPSSASEEGADISVKA